MSELTNEQRCKDALGVLPIETVLAQEHDRIHGDDVAVRISRISYLFAAEHITAPAAFAHRLLRAWRQFCKAGARASRPSVVIDVGPLSAEKAPLDAVAIYVLGAITEANRPAIYSALGRCDSTRADYLARPHAGNGAPGRADYATTTRVTMADAALVTAMVPHLNYLLEQPLEKELAFASFIRDGAIDALGDNDANTNQRLRRLLLEAAFAGQLRCIRDLRLNEVYAAVRKHDTAALCLSGGGIRSATFALGVIRGLAHYGLLSRFDYLSTVSGGGYAGSWLSAWMHHTSAAEVQDELRRPNRDTLSPEPAPVENLRAYSHFLAPHVGMFSTDTWTLVATIGRNLVLNWLVLIPLMAAVLLAPRFIVALLKLGYGEIPWYVQNAAGPILVTLLVTGLALGVWAARFVHLSRPGSDSALDDEASLREKSRAGAGTQRKFVTNCFVPLVVASLVLTTGLYLWWVWGGGESRFTFLRSHRALVYAFGASGGLMHLGGWLLAGRFRHPKEALSTSISGVIAGLTGLTMGVWFLSRPETADREMLYATLAPPAFLCVMLVGSQLFTALTSFNAGDDEREWVTRFNAWLLIAIVVWAALCGLVLYGPLQVKELWQQLTVAGVGGASGLISVFLARNEANARPGVPGGIATMARKAALVLAAPVFIVAIIIALAALNEHLIASACDLPVAPTVFDCQAMVPRPGVVPAIIIGVFVLLVTIGRLLGSRIDTNKFSLRAMYEMRLVRAYLGASRPPCDRQPNPFTGFDPRDDFPIGKLWPATEWTLEKGGRAPACPPMHVVNVTLNLVAGGNLAWQQRKAESMTITPLHAGSVFVGYRPTTLGTVPVGASDTKPRLYGGKRGITLGTAVTISGAAASPNAGSHSSPTITFLMTFFNARLGAWLGNPGRAGADSFDHQAPTEKIKPILDEMFGMTSDHSPYVYLSDGGHFENLALYEMVLRRCRFILVSDAGCDPTTTFDDLGNAVRKIRVDLGIPIEFPDGVDIFSRDNPKPDGSGSYWAVGRIKYSAVDSGDSDDATDGLLLYIKPALYGREPSDVQQYARSSPLFPHEPTSDQFFSESQFESYRALGEFIVTQLVANKLVAPHIDIKGRRADSLLTNWTDLIKSSDAHMQIPLRETGVWPTAVGEPSTV